MTSLSGRWDGLSKLGILRGVFRSATPRHSWMSWMAIFWSSHSRRSGFSDNIKKAGDGLVFIPAWCQKPQSVPKLVFAKVCYFHSLYVSTLELLFYWPNDRGSPFSLYPGDRRRQRYIFRPMEKGASSSVHIQFGPSSSARQNNVQIFLCAQSNADQPIF